MNVIPAAMYAGIMDIDLSAPANMRAKGDGHQYAAYGAELARRLNIDDAPMRATAAKGFMGDTFYLVAK
ncbi:hypothetical protein [Sinorhizobium mexicanum]|uniref:Uncharacterized protein n=1 Tax=Sinorhizobium mexicanum TaxID=375549 RepID=A0A859R304_9HYPH|nr:hypothetical protein [Sinorhizobium mexicanum]MBP1886385.1 hypothetical protein [Sinorhizobium mexicanum]QLL64018.1 hypothetical protein FKV68_21355 [Sinorhizobium mexicanum]